MPLKNDLPAHAAAALSQIPAAEKYLVGVSGGRDSVTLLHVLLGLGFNRLIVCHLDHGLRGSESAGDARFVERLAQGAGLKCVVAKSAVAKNAAAKKMSLETAAREARHRFFARVAKREKCRAIFLGHHADDQVETFLFNLFRGAGPAGLGAMRIETELRIGGFALRIVRPMLSVWRSEIDRYAAAHRLAFRDDESNRSLANTRSKMRGEILPAIEKALGRDVRKSIWKTAEILREQHDFLEKTCGAESPRLSTVELRALPVALQRIIIHRWLRQNGVREIGYGLMQSIRELLEVPATRSKVNLPRGRFVRRRAKELFLE